MSKAQSSYAVLLKTGRGHREELTKDGSQLRPVLTDKGTLLVNLDSLTATRIQKKFGLVVNYKLADRREIHHCEVFLFDNGSNVLFITAIQRDLLLGVKQQLYWMEVLGRLQWVELLTVGSEAYVTIATIPAPVKGIVRYIGNLSGEEGRQFGIEIMVWLLDSICNSCNAGMSDLPDMYVQSLRVKG